MAVFCLPELWGQKATQLRLNELLVVNESNFIDGYGEHGSWIEIYNTSAATVDIKGCYLTNDPDNLKLYPIPKGDVQTRIPPHQHLLFWADGRADRGTFHLNFTLDQDKPNFVALVDADGITIIDRVEVPTSANTPDVSYGRLVDGHGSLDGQQGWTILEKVTPSTNNVTLDSNEKIERLKREDTNGFIMTVTAMLVVFLALLSLSLAFKLIGRQAISISRTRAAGSKYRAIAVSPEMVSIPGETLAAIALALKAELDSVHDEEDTVITIDRVERKYSPWSSKVHNLRRMPERRVGYHK
ncbi:membrane protein associated with methylmalonyl-CoA decarboxylase [Porphyromonas crevioricanis JCM 15906]|uniref:Membrane protein associated with methylmalonyl-CoA decarboxylase n=1 Tax=Porphyromonas crevioricanis JCM 15906 TaxID=1305617 RepID=T1CSF3_9PORP|nr:membrane protein associated with methylmalonyl-CoA decarboxylase [Porphyromonas crevioricanis JCM 15906]GAD06977.1 membrane protein associated with methylmalonyl-CoA decarboxylase [Porphyromonas crevioricanis JCM 13913]